MTLETTASPARAPKWRRLLLWALCAGFFLLAAAYLGYRQVMKPRMYKTVTSPDGSWSVTVVRQRSAPPPLDGVDVIVQVRSRSQELLHEEKMDNRDLWIDVEERYYDVTCTDEEIRIGPGWWDGSAEGYWILRKSDLKGRR